LLHTKTHCGIGFLLLLLAVACGSGSYNPESTLVDVGGHRLNIRCSGEGSPAVILGSGLASSNHDWGPVEERVSAFTQVCSYDRAGLGESDGAGGVPTAQTASDSLHSLLSGAGINGPVVLVGHSYGGLVAQLYAAQHPENTAALVLVDSLEQNNLVRAGEILGDQAMAAFLRATQSNPEGVDVVASIDQARSAGNLGDLPLTVVTAGAPDLPPFIDRGIRDQLAGSWLESQQDLVRLSTLGVHVIAQESGHCVQCYQPKLVADSILRDVARARNR
jgi:pimeloyl-ACP methyl ester carboxylesterase